MSLVGFKATEYKFVQIGTWVELPFTLGMLLVIDH